jgi:hypothetical protein
LRVSDPRFEPSPSASRIRNRNAAKFVSNLQFECWDEKRLELNMVTMIWAGVSVEEKCLRIRIFVIVAK